jgi:hypothetical protein
MNLAFVNNQSFVLTLNIAAWAPVLPLTATIFHMQMRMHPEDVDVIYSWSSNPADGWGNGTITYSDTTNLLIIRAPQNEMRIIPPGTYTWDLLVNYLGFYKDFTTGQISFIGGTTID